MESFEVQGLWWLPEHDDNKVPGALSWDPNSGGTLRLVGQLWPVVLLDNELPNGQVQKYRDHNHDSDRLYPVVLGKEEKTAYTLLNGFQTMKRDWSLEQSAETVHVNAVLEGALFDGPDIEIDQARFRMRDLAGWVDVSGLEITYPRMDRTGEEYAVVAATSMPDFVVSPAWPKVALGHRLGVSVTGNDSAGIEQDWVLAIDQDQVAPVQTFVEVASDFQDLVSIATGRTAEFRSVVLHHPELPQLSLAGAPMGKARQELIYHAQWTNRVDYDAKGPKSREPMSGLRMYFTLDHIGSDGVGRWLDTAARFRTELGRAMATRYARGAYLEDRIMNVCAALESFDKHHRGTHDEVWYAKRIAACVDLAGDVFRDLIVEDSDDWSKRVKELRHDLAHHRAQFRLDGSVGGHLISEQLFWLFALCVLRVAQAPDAVFDSIAKHPQWTWLRGKAREALNP
jgi:hypothetical protein